MRMFKGLRDYEIAAVAFCILTLLVIVAYTIGLLF